MNSYTYRIDFANGDYYFGWHPTYGAEPESDGYFGSPVTNKHRWQEDIYCKTVIALHATYQIALDHESELIGDNYITDKHCLNECNHRHGFSFAGRKHSDETKKRYSQMRKGRRISEETAKLISQINKGKKRSLECRKRMKSAQQKRAPEISKFYQDHPEKKRKSNITKDEIELMKEMRANGKSLRYIGEKTGYNFVSIRNYLNGNFNPKW